MFNLAVRLGVVGAILDKVGFAHVERLQNFVIFRAGDERLGLPQCGPEAADEAVQGLCQGQKLNRYIRRYLGSCFDASLPRSTLSGWSA